MGNKWESYQPSFKDLISFLEVSEITCLATKHLRLMISRSKLWAERIGFFWVTTDNALSDYLKIRSKPSRKPQKPMDKYAYSHVV